MFRSLIRKCTHTAAQTINTKIGGSKSCWNWETVGSLNVCSGNTLHVGLWCNAYITVGIGEQPAYVTRILKSVRD